MGNKPPPPEPPKPKTVKGTTCFILNFEELVREFSKSINRLKRDFAREIMKME